MTDHISPEFLRFERLLEAPIDKVWSFLTDPDLRARWFMAGPSDLRPGGALGLTMDHDRLSDQPSPTPERYRAYIGHSWEERITRYAPPHLLAITWEGGKAGEVTFELSQQGDRTRLVLTHVGLRGRKDAVNFGSGWSSHLNVLDKRLRDEPIPDFWALHAASEAEMSRALD